MENVRPMHYGMFLVDHPFMLKSECFVSIQEWASIIIYTNRHK